MKENEMNVTALILVVASEAHSSTETVFIGRYMKYCNQLLGSVQKGRNLFKRFLIQ